jgi:hypothetical protein
LVAGASGAPVLAIRDRIGRPGTARRSFRVAAVAGSADIWVARAESRRGLAGMSVPMVADPDSSRPELFTRAEQLRAQSQALWEQVAEVADAVAEVEQDVARVHEDLAEQGGPLAEQAREHANRARGVAARERAEAQRLRRAGPS